LRWRCGGGGSDCGVDDGGECNGEVRAVARAAANAIATAAATVVAAALVTARDGCVGFGGGSDSGGNNDGSGQRTTTAQHHFRPNQARTASPKMCRTNLSSWNTCGRGIGIGDANGHDQRRTWFPCCAHSLSFC